MKARAALAGALLAAAALSAAACTSSPGRHAGAYLTVTVDFNPRWVSGPDTSLHVDLEERSESGERRLVGRAIERLDGRMPPVDVRLAYDPGQVDATAAYTVRARIERRGVTILPDSRAVPVLTQGASDTASIRMGGP